MSLSGISQLGLSKIKTFLGNAPKNQETFTSKWLDRSKSQSVENAGMSKKRRNTLHIDNHMMML